MVGGGENICVRCVMDDSDIEIVFDVDGVCNHCRRYDRLMSQRAQEEPGGTIDRLAARIRGDGAGKDYDCILGVSGGVDSSYVALQAKRLGLRPLAVHLDNGWNSELAVQNIEQIVRRLEIDLDTHVIDWTEFRDLQLALLRASVVDIEMLTDHAITAVLHRLALQHGVRWILSGKNTATEAIMPATWIHRKSDLRNLKSIHRTFGKVGLKTFPTASTVRLEYLHRVRRLTALELLDHLDYERSKAIAELEGELQWRPYAGKHYESFFTRFYQSYILPTKFGIDKRRAHYSTLICSSQMSREAALAELAVPPCDPDTVATDTEYVLKKLGLSEVEFDQIMKLPPRSHYDFASEDTYLRPALWWRQRRAVSPA